jgi:hypothetical protein
MSACNFLIVVGFDDKKKGARGVAKGVLKGKGIKFGGEIKT